MTSRLRGTDRGLAVGLFPGSFDPAHRGHRHLADTALRRLALDQVWWIPSPQNPLKSDQSPYAERAASVRALRLPPRMRVTHVERDLDTRYTVDTIRSLRKRFPRTRFVLLLGADNLAQLPLWKDWKRLLRLVPLAVVSRPGEEMLRARTGRVARQFARHRLLESAARTLKNRPPPAWVFITSPLDGESSSRIRAETAKAFEH